MSGLYIPSFSESLAVAQTRGADSEAPHLWNGLVAHWPFLQGGGHTLFDTSGHGNHGTLTNMDPATDWVTTGQRGLSWALDMDAGLSQYVACQDDLRLNFTGDHTLSVWVKPTDHTTGFVSRYFEAEANGWRFGLIWHEPGNSALLYYNQGCGTEKSGGGHVSYTDGKYYLCCVVVDVNVGGTFYVDGQEVGSWSDATSAPASATTAVPTIGMYGDPNGSPVFLTGGIASVMLYDQILLPNEIQQLYVDPLAMVRPRVKVFPAAAPPVGAGGNPLHMESPLLGSVA